MTKKNKEGNVNLFYIDKDIETQNEIDSQKKKQNKEREKRIKQMNKERSLEQYDIDTETVINMTNKKRKEEIEKYKKELIQEKKKKNKKKKFIKRILKILTLFVILIGGFVFALTSPIFNIIQIDVEGNEIISSDTIISISELELEQNIFKFNTREIEENIKQNPYVESVKIDRVFPNKIKINIEERQKKFSLSFLNTYAYLNSQGYILEISEDKQEMPVIIGASTPEENIVPGSRLEIKDLEKLEIAIKIVDVFKEKELDKKISSIDISNSNDYIVNIEEEKKIIHLGDGTDLSNKVLYVIVMLEQEKNNEGDCYINGDLNNNFQPYFRQRVVF